jgi:uncharacterized protein (DUF1778 family)
MHKHSRVSARVSPATKESLLRFSESRGLKRSFVVEQALLYFMEARRALPDEAIIPARLVLAGTAFDKLLDRLKTPPAPKRRLRALMPGIPLRRKART